MFAISVGGTGIMRGSVQARREKARGKAKIAREKEKAGEKTVAKMEAKAKDGEAEKDQG